MDEGIELVFQVVMVVPDDASLRDAKEYIKEALTSYLAIASCDLEHPMRKLNTGSIKVSLASRRTE